MFPGPSWSTVCLKLAAMSQRDALQPQARGSTAWAVLLQESVQRYRLLLETGADVAGSAKEEELRHVLTHASKVNLRLCIDQGVKP